MTNFFEFQRQARKKSFMVQVAFLCFLLLLSAIYSSAIYFYFKASSSEGPIPWTTQLIFLGVLFVVFYGAYFFQQIRYKSQPLSLVLSMLARQLTYNPSQNLTQKERQLLNTVEEMCIAAGIPVVKTFVLYKEPGINAFTSGHDLRTAHIVVTQGALDHFTREEMQAVVAHEVGHIVSADVKANMHLMSCIFALNFLVTIGAYGIRGARFSSTGRSRSSKRGGGAGGGILLLALLLIVLGYIGSILGRAFQSLFSRQREFLADSLGVQFTRNPSALASALAKIRDMLDSEIHHSEAMNMSHMCIAPAVRSSLWGRVFASHPPVDERIKLLDAQFLKPHKDVVEYYKKEFKKPEPQDKTLREQQGLAAKIPVPAREIIVGGVFDPILAMEQAKKSLGRVEKAVVETLLHDVQDFKYPVWSLLLAHDNEVKAKQIKILQDMYAESFSQEKLDQVLKHQQDSKQGASSVLAIAMPLAQELPTKERLHFLQSLKNIMMADHNLCAFETIVSASFQVLCTTESTKARLNLDHIRRLLLLFSDLNEGSQKEKDEAYQRAVAEYFHHNQEVLQRPKESLNLQNLVNLMFALKDRNDSQKQEILQAVTKAVNNDKHIGPKESEALRAFSMALNVPASTLSI